MPEWQRTIQSTIEWSYGLLEEPARWLFRRLSVFHGGSPLGAVEAVADFDGVFGADIVHLMETLISNSLLRQRVGSGNQGGEPRFEMLRLMREYAHMLLEESGEAEVLQQRHAHYYLDLAETAAPFMNSGKREAWLDLLDAEHDNLRAALALDSWTARCLVNCPAPGRSLVGILVLSRAFQ